MADGIDPDQADGGRQKRVKRDEVRRRLLAAAYGVFAQRGYEGASLERVAEAAGFSKGAVYSNFGNKDELFFELIAARIDERSEAVRAAAAKRAEGGPPATSGTSLAGARQAGEELRAMGEADPDWQLLFIEFWLRCAKSEELRAKLAERRLIMRTKIAELFEAEIGAAGRTVSRAEAMDLATIILALSNGLGIEGLIDPKAVRPALFGEVLARIVSAAI